MEILQHFIVFSLLGWALGIVHVSWGMHDGQEDSFREHVSKECGYARYPGLCVETLQSLGHKNGDIVYTLIEKTRDETKLLTPNLQNQRYQLESLEAKHAHVTIGYCVELTNMSMKRLNQTLLSLEDSRPKNMQDIQTWLSAVITFQQTCKDSIKELSGEFVGQISGKMEYISRLASNSLALVNRMTHNSTAPTTNRRLTSEQLFPEWVSVKDRKLLQTTEIKANAVVAKDGSGNYETVSEAIKAASGGRFVIYVKSGVYKEKIHTNKDGITLIGDGKYSTIIVGEDSVAGGSSLSETATFAINGDGFIARDIGFQNTAGPEGGQALALSVSSDQSVLYKCSIVGYQDTLYALALRQFYRECDIHGTIDFIFGNAAAVFQNCYLVLRKPQPKSYNVILANGRSDPEQNTGFSVHNCRIIPSSDFSPFKNSINSYLGRPWKDYSRAVIMKSTIDEAIEARGWIEWSGNFALKTLYFAEYLNEGPGAGTSERVKWPGYHVIGTEEAIKFTVGKFIAGTSWIPSTGVSFISGLS